MITLGEEKLDLEIKLKLNQVLTPRKRLRILNIICNDPKSLAC